MNKYQEALDRFKVVSQNDWINNYQKCKDEEKTIHIGNYRMFEIDGEAIKALQELVDKENPMEVNMEDYHLEDEYQYPIYICPKCTKHITDGDSYCRHCGQRLDWSDDNAED